MLKVRIETKNAAFEVGHNIEVCACLAEVIQKIEEGKKDGKIYDSNGNPTGIFKLTNR